MIKNLKVGEYNASVASDLESRYREATQTGRAGQGW